MNNVVNRIEKTNQVGSVSLLSDTPSEPKQDRLDYQAYCDAIISIIQGLPSDTPFTMGIFGSWGSGKTTLLKMIQCDLDKQKKHSIWVNVWKFGNDEDVWKSFLQALLIRVKGELPWYKKWLFHLGLINKRMNWVEIGNKIPELIVKIVITVIPLYLSLTGFVVPSKIYTLNSIKNVIPAMGGTVLGALLAWFLILQPYLQAVNEKVKIDLQGLVKGAPLKKRVSLLEEFNSYFEIMVKSLISKKEKITVFIDDLDRCPPERIVQVLELNKAFLGFAKLCLSYWDG
ncbi:MAG: P-loop NTPase fold protein [Anaerolineales bacterium]